MYSHPQTPPATAPRHVASKTRDRSSTFPSLVTLPDCSPATSRSGSYKRHATDYSPTAWPFAAGAAVAHGNLYMVDAEANSPGSFYQGIRNGSVATERGGP
jgi:hypothetical protein